MCSVMYLCFSSRKRHTRCSLVTGVQTCALPISSYNFSAFSPFHTFPAGHEDGNHWGPAVALLKTSARSPYYFNFHSADLGHSMVIGPSGGGKTVLVNFLMAQLEKFNARHIFIDKDQGAEIF